jgi:hypothetical protein
MSNVVEQLEAAGWQPFDDLIILTKDGKAVRLEPNDQQIRVLEAIASQQEAGVPVRIIILKFRQGGFSTITEATIFREVKGRKNVHGLVAAHNDDSSETLFRMTRRFHDNLPEQDQLPTEYSSKREIVYRAPHNSMMRVQTAGNNALGRAQTNQYLHLSEAAWWPHAKESLGSVLQSVPDKRDTMVVIESTANGVGGEFYERWQKAVQHRMAHPNDLTGYLPLFFSWLDYAEYSTALPAGYALADEDEDERFLRTLGAKDEQLYWRRRMIAENCGGDASLFKQEYPATAEEAFQMSGRPAIPVAITQYHRSTVEQYRRGRFVEDARLPNGVRLVFEDTGESWGDDDSWWRIYRTPEEDHDYTVAGDVAEGSLADPSDERSEPDYSDGTVLDRIRLEDAATYHGRPDPDLFGEQLWLAARYYNGAWVSPETNAAGVAATLFIKRKNYVRLYRRQGADEKISTDDSELLGWKTTTANRNELWDHWLEYCRPDPVEGFTGQIIVHDLLTVMQEEQAVWNKNKKREHRAGGHDDSIFAHMIALELHLRC